MKKFILVMSLTLSMIALQSCSDSDGGESISE